MKSTQHPLIESTAKYFQSIEDRFIGLSGRDRWGRVDLKGERRLDISASPKGMPKAISLFQSLVGKAEKLKITFRLLTNHRTVAVVNGEEIEIRLQEHCRPARADEVRSPWRSVDYVHSGIYSLSINSYAASPIARKVMVKSDEDLDRFVQNLINAVPAIRKYREESERRHARMIAAEKLEKEERRRKQSLLSFIEEFGEYRKMKALLSEARSEIDPAVQNKHKEYFDWAISYVESFNPVPDMEEEIRQTSFRVR